MGCRFSSNYVRSPTTIVRLENRQVPLCIVNHSHALNNFFSASFTHASQDSYSALIYFLWMSFDLLTHHRTLIVLWYNFVHVLWFVEYFVNIFAKTILALSPWIGPFYWRGSRRQGLRQWRETLYYVTIDGNSSGDRALGIPHLLILELNIVAWTKRPTFSDNIFKVIFVNQKWCILTQLLLKFISKGWMNDTPIGLDNGWALIKRQAIF